MVTYVRGDGGITLTKDQLLELQALFDQQQDIFDLDESAKGLGVPIYAKIFEWITDIAIVGYTNNLSQAPIPIYGYVPKPGVDPSVWRWIEGAKRVNSGEGFFADFIRESTKVQFELRGGNPAFFDEYNQEASNRIALTLAADILKYKGLLPGPMGLGAIDAGAAASTVFGKLPDGNDDYAPWAGSLLFPYLGIDDFFIDLLLKSEQVSAEIGIEPEKIIKYTEGTYDLIAMLQAAQKAGLAAGYDNKFDAIINLLYPRVIDRNQDTVIEQTNEFFNQYYSLGNPVFSPGDDLVFNRFQSALNNTPLVDVKYQVGKYQNDTLVIEDSDTSVIMNGGRGDDSLTGGEKDDLIDGDQGNDTLNGGKGGDYLYGGKDDDKLYGNEGFDRLYGGAGNDELEGGSDSDYLYGDVGNDTYIFNGNFGRDLIKDSYGDGSIVINGVTLSGFVPYLDGTLYQGHVYIDSSKTVLAIKYSTANSAGGDTSTIVFHPLSSGESSVHSPNAVTIKGWAPGDLRLSFSESTSPSVSARPPAAAPALPPSPPRDPLVFDLNGDGKIGTLAISNGVHFDLDNSGFAERTSWVAPQDALLVLDRNANGFIDGGAELFGTETLLGNGKYAAHGFEALAEFDGNNDGLIDNNDAKFSDFRLWQDSNSNDLADIGELKTLNELNVISINTSFTRSITTDVNNVEHREAGIFQFGNGRSGITNTLWFESDRRVTKPVTELQGNVSIIPEAIKNLPNAVGFGNTYSLHYAMAMDTSGALQKKVQEFSVEVDSEKRHLLLREILVLWTGKTNVQIGSRGTAVDATSLLILESFWGQPALQHNPSGVYAQSVNNAYLDLEKSVYSQLMSNTHMKYLFDRTSFAEINGKWVADYSMVLDVFVSGFISGDELVSKDMMEFITTIQGMGSDSLYQPLIDLIEVTAEALAGPVRAEMLGAIHAHGEHMIGTHNADVMEGFGGVDSIRGGEGNDSLYGGSDSDLLYGEDGSDELHGDEGRDWLYGGQGNDDLTGGVGDDDLFGGKENDSLFGGNDNDRLYGDEGDDELHGEDGRDWLFGGQGIDSLYGDDGNDTLAGGDGNDNLIGGEGDDEIIGGEGNDTLLGGVGRDSLYGGEGNDTYVLPLGEALSTGNYMYTYISDNGGINKISFDNNVRKSDIVSIHNAGPYGVSLYFGDDIVGRITVDAGSIDFFESFMFANGDELTIDEIKMRAVKSSDGNDTLYGFSTNDIITGGKGNDDIIGYSGDDIYVYNKDDGSDQILESSGTDKILFGGGINQGDITVEIHGESISLGMGALDKILIVNMLNQDGILKPDNAIEKVEFANGDTWDVEQILARARSSVGLQLISSASNETLVGTQKNDVLNGKGGVDYLYGGIGNDKYVYELGGNRDFVADDGGTDWVVFGEGIIPEQFKIRRVETDIKMDIDTSTGITLKGLVTSAGKIKSDLIIESFEFSNGTVWSTNDLFKLATTGTNLSDEIHGFTHADAYEGRKGDDLFIDYGGNDLYVFNRGDGRDAIQDAGGNDTVVFGSGVSVSDVIVRQVNDGSLVLSYGDDNVGVQFVFDAEGIENPEKSIEIVRFSNDETWSKQELFARALLATVHDDTIIGFATADTLTAYGGFDVLNGKGGDDVYKLTAGQFIGTKIQDSAGSNDVIELAGNFTKESLTTQIDGNDLIVSVYSGESIHIVGGAVLGGSIESIRFANNDTLSQEQLIAGASLITKNDTNVVSGSSHSDQILGVSWNDSLSGGDGDDSLYGGSGHDTLQGGVGADYLYGGNGNDILNGDSGNDVLFGHLGDDSLNGGDGDDLIFGGRGEDILSGGLGDDYLEFGRSLSGGDGNDILFVKADNRSATLDGGTGNDTFKIGTSAARTSNEYDVPWIKDSSGIDKIQLTDEWNPAAIGVTFDTGKNYVVFFRADEFGTKNVLFKYDTIKLANNEIDVSRIESVEFANGDVWDANDIRQKLLKGSIGNDTLQGYISNDSLEGGKGDDELKGYAGNDVYLYSRGDGRDIIEESTGIDTIRFTDINENAQIRISKNINDLVIVIDENSSILVKDMFSSFDGNGPISELRTIDYIEFADGKRWDLSRIYAETLRSTDGNDTITGFNANDYIDGGLGNDYLIGNGGHDTLIGGKGNDFLAGGIGGRTEYYFSLGDGIDTVRANAASDEIIQFGEGVNASDLVVERTANGHLSIAYSPTDKILLESAFSNPGSNKPKIDNLVEKLTFLNAPDIDFLQLVGSLGFDISRPVISSVNFDPTGSRVTGIATPGTEVYLDLDSSSSQWRAFTDSVTGAFVIELGVAYINAQAFTIKTYDSGYNASPSVSIRSPDLSPPIKPTATLSTDGKVISGTGEVGSIVVVKNSTTNAEIASITIQNANGQYSLNLPLPLLNGEKIAVFAKDVSENASASVALTAKDTTAPAVPTASFDAAGKIITGIAEAGSTVIVKNAGGTQLKSAVADASSAYSITLTTALINKELVNVTAKDPAGNTSVAIPIIAPDKTAPSIPTASFDAAGLVITGVAEAGSTVSVKNTGGTELKTTTANATTGAYTITLTTALINKETVNVTAKDAAGNISAIKAIIAPDKTAPSTPTASFDAAGLVITGVAEAGSTVSVKNTGGTELKTATANATTGAYSITLTTALINKETVNITAKDAAGNISAIKSIIAPDKTAPSAPTASFDAAGLVITGVAEAGSTVSVKNAGGTELKTATANATTGAYSITLTTALINKETVNVTAKDAAGNISAIKSIIAPDKTAPTIPTASFDTAGKVITGVAEAGSTVSVKNAGGTELKTATANATTGAYSITLTTALINKETVNVTAKDAAGNISAIKAIVAPDKTPPAAPTASIDTARKVITGIAEAGSVVEVKTTTGSALGSITAHVTTGAYTITLATALTLNQTVNVTAKDAAGNISAIKSLVASGTARSMFATAALTTYLDAHSTIVVYAAEKSRRNDVNNTADTALVGVNADSTVTVMSRNMEEYVPGRSGINALIQAMASFEPAVGIDVPNRTVSIDQHRIVLSVAS